MPTSSPIVVLDSGVGGLTVVAAIRRAMPAEDVIYFGDTARLPYGSKSAATVTAFVKQIIRYLQPRNPKHVVIACNTATALALPAVRAAFPDLSVSGVIEPGARAAVAAAGAKRVPVIAVIATEATVRSKAYERAILRRRNHAHVYSQPTPLLAPIVEEGRTGNDMVVQFALRGYLSPLAAKKPDVLVLGCTHYPMLKEVIGRTIGSKVVVIDSAEQCAQDVARRLEARKLLAPVGEPPREGKLHCFVTDDSPRFAPLASRFLGVPVETPTWVSPDELYAFDLLAPVGLRLMARPA